MFRRWMTGNVVWMVSALVYGGGVSAAAQEGNRHEAAYLCPTGTIAARQTEFQRLVALKRFQPWAVSDETLRTASAEYVEAAENCYALAGPSVHIDEGPLLAASAAGVQPFAVVGAKWGAGSFSGGVDVRGPGLPGGTVTYSFMGSGVAMGSHSDANVSITALPGYQACFLTEIRQAFAAWSAVANIQFAEVPDNGAPFDASGATGDIRIGAHAFDGQWGALAHGYYPPPGSSAAGDIHFDRHEIYSCDARPGTVDVGIIAMHEIGHAIGLGHEVRAGHTALMNPSYNPISATMLLADDVQGAVGVYGLGVSASDSLVVNFGGPHGLWDLEFGRGWQQLSGLSPEDVVNGDLDGNGIDEVVGSFGSHGLWIRWNNTSSWTRLYAASPTRMVIGDFDGNGRGDLVMSFSSGVLYVWYNAATWGIINSIDPTLMAVGNIDGIGSDDLIVSVPGRGVWTFRNNTTWVQIHPLEVATIAVGALDAAGGPDDILLNFTGYGLYAFVNASGWWHLHSFSPKHLALGMIDSDPRGDIVADFGPGTGVWMLKNHSTWVSLHGRASEGVTLADFDGNSQKDIVIDFGSNDGFWMYVNGASWLQGHPYNPTNLSAADLK